MRCRALVTFGLAVLALASGGCVRGVAARSENWWSIRTAHVHVETDAGRDRGIAEAQRLETLHRALAASFYHCADHDRRVDEVTILARESEMAAFFPDGAGVSLHATDGLMAFPSRIVTSTQALDAVGGPQIAAHELTHGLVDACFPDAPTWVQEGLASVFETMIVPDPRTVVFGYPSRRASGTPYLWTRVERGEVLVTETPFAVLPPAHEIVRLSYTDFHQPTAIRAIAPTALELRAANYTAATQLAYLLALGPWMDLRSRFLGYLEALRDGEDRERAFETAFEGIDLDARLAAFLARPQYHVHSRRIPGGDTSEPIVTAMSPAEAHLRWAELDLRSPVRAARAEIEAHLASAAHDPSWRAQTHLFRAVMSPIGARARVAEAEAVAPDDLDVLRARAVIALAERDQPTIERLAMRLEIRTDLRASDEAVLAELERAAGRLDQAEARAVALLRADRGAWRAWNVIGEVALDRGDTVRASRVASRLRRIADDHASGEVRAAVEALDAVLSPVP